MFFLPHHAFAWAPTTHLELGTTVLNNLSLLSPPVKALIEKFPFDYLYGNISADIIIGKKYAGNKTNNILEILETTHLGPKKSLSLVRVADKSVLVGT
ncbi:MAG: flagellar biosynthetic protein FliO, partial [Thermodesulfobacteriota bacterium]